MLIALAACATSADGVGRPNFVFVLADDLGWCDVSTGRTNLGNANRFVETPTVERLADEGVAFTNAYTAGPNCAPTRAALLTGRYGSHPDNNIFNVGHLRRGPHDSLLIGAAQGLPSGKDGIPNHATTYAEVLKSVGYRTAHFGKFHVADRDSAALGIVRYHGFAENFGGNQRGAPKHYHASSETFGAHIGPELDAYAGDYTAEYIGSNIRPFSRGVPRRALERLIGEPKHVSDALADAAIDFMSRCDGAPFLVQFNAYAVHTPIGPEHARPDLLRKYRAKAGHKPTRDASFAALVEGLDQSVGRLLRYLESTDDPAAPGQPLAANTIVIFYSDNGGKLPQSDNGPLRGQKGELREGGIRVPLIAWSSNPALVARGRVCDTPVTSVDFLPTLASLGEAGSEPATSDGVDLSSLFADPTVRLERESIFWHFPGYLVGSKRDQRPQSVVRSGRWKLTYSYETQTHELYDLEADIGERHDLAAVRPAVVARVSKQLLTWLKSTRAPLATLRDGTLDVRDSGARYPGRRAVEGFDADRVSAGDRVPYVSEPTSNSERAEL